MTSHPDFSIRAVVYWDTCGCTLSWCKHTPFVSIPFFCFGWLAEGSWVSRSSSQSWLLLLRSDWASPGHATSCRLWWENQGMQRCCQISPSNSHSEMALLEILLIYTPSYFMDYTMHFNKTIIIGKVCYGKYFYK